MERLLVERTSPQGSGASVGVTAGQIICTTKVFVGNLPYTVTWQELKDSMRQVGEVVHVELFTDHGDPKGRSKGCGVVEFTTYGAARRAVQYMHDTMIQGRLMYVREYYEDMNGRGRRF
ncbi:unnamed protein product [Cladocopium goreaui]|uniref:Uncharacterized RNA-binding protein C328.05 n=1 Tax=Cladocopium goreaui TaxID=2562237 RepID=A0A9P1FYH3_9DINO|nr:unnamed protein product [Cladocopium goreaui]